MYVGGCRCQDVSADGALAASLPDGRRTVPLGLAQPMTFCEPTLEICGFPQRMLGYWDPVMHKSTTEDVFHRESDEPDLWSSKRVADHITAMNQLHLRLDDPCRARLRRYGFVLRVRLNQDGSIDMVSGDVKSLTHVPASAGDHDGDVASRFDFPVVVERASQLLSTRFAVRVLIFPTLEMPCGHFWPLLRALDDLIAPKAAMREIPAAPDRRVLRSTETAPNVEVGAVKFQEQPEDSDADVLDEHLHQRFNLPMGAWPRFSMTLAHPQETRTYGF